MIVRLLTMSIVALFVSGSAHAEDLVVIVHPERIEGARSLDLDLSDIVQIYLKQRRFWRDGTAILPVNREAGSETRERFAKVAFGARARNLVSYWNREYFRGVLPPITLASDQAVRRFVASEPRAIGYVPARLVDDSVRVAYRFE